MKFLTLLSAHWFDLLQSAGIVFGLIYTSLALSLDSRSRRAELIFEATKAYRAIWSELLDHPRLTRILEYEPDLKSSPITVVEERFTLLLLLHLTSVHQAIELQLYPRWRGIEEDIRRFFSLPIPRRILRKHLPFQRPEFRRYILEILELHHPKG